MRNRGTGFIHLYLPLLTDLQLAVRRQAFLLLLANYGEHGLTMLRRLLSSDDHEVRRQATLALQQIAELTDIVIDEQPFEGIYIECLGHTQLFVGNRELQIDAWVRQKHRAVGWQKVQALLAYLLHCGRHGTTRASLEASIWGSTTPTTLGRTLKTLRLLLTDLLGEEKSAQILTITDQFCVLNPELYRSDVQVFEQTFHIASYTEELGGLAAAAPLYTQALQLYGGPYMIDIVQGTPWAQSRREHLRGSFLIAAERVAEHSFHEARYNECIKLCTQVFDSDESADEIVIWLLRAYTCVGYSGAIKHIYQRYLHANALDEQSPEASQDIVVQAYHELHASLAQ